MTNQETCANCGFIKKSHERKNFFKKQNIKMMFADKIGLQPCKKFQSQTPPEYYCLNERPPRKVFCQLKKGHKGSHSAVILWE